jgi:hypothetical protein
MAFRELKSMRADSDNNLLTKIVESLAVSIGQRGHDLFSAPGDHTGEWVLLHAITTCTVIVNRDNVSENITLVAGDRIYGQITLVNVSSGTAEVYRAN